LPERDLQRRLSSDRAPCDVAEKIDEVAHFGLSGKFSGALGNFDKAISIASPSSETEVEHDKIKVLDFTAPS
jgi:hypothetical protein